MGRRLRNTGKKKYEIPVLQVFTENTYRNTRKETTGKKAGFQKTGKKHRETQRYLLKPGNTSEIRQSDIHEHRQMITVPSLIPHSPVRPEGLHSPIGFIRLKQERKLQYTGLLVGSMEITLTLQQGTAHNQLVQHAPLSPMPVRSPRPAVHQVIQRIGRNRRARTYSSQHLPDRAVGRIIIKITHDDKIRTGTHRRQRIRHPLQDKDYEESSRKPSY